MRDADVYRQQGFGQKIACGERPALLVVDFVNGFLDPAIFGGGNIVEAAQRTKPLLESARGKGLPVVFTRIVYSEDGSDAGVWCEKAPRLKTLTESAAASQVVDFLAPRAGELVVRKTQASAFFATDLSSYLTYRGVDSVIIVGCTTSGCVRATVVDAISHNFRPIVVADCVGDRAQAPHEANLFDIGQKYADLLDLTEALKWLSAVTGRENKVST
jgi:maleamate amidohydrolase